jgi:amino acid transporter
MRGSSAVAADVLQLSFGAAGGTAISTLICLSCLGTINGMLFTGSRVSYAAGAEHSLIRWLGTWNRRFDTPLRALLIQLAVILALILGFGDEQGFERLVRFTTPVFWAFATLTGVSLFVLRWKDPQARRPHPVVLYPLTPLLFCLSCLFMLHASVTYAWTQRAPEALWTLGILAAGALASCWDRRIEGAHQPEE